MEESDFYEAASLLVLCVFSIPIACMCDDEMIGKDICVENLTNNRVFQSRIDV